jgi:hypothetical protein
VAFKVFISIDCIGVCSARLLKLGAVPVIGEAEQEIMSPETFLSHNVYVKVVLEGNNSGPTADPNTSA